MNKEDFFEVLYRLNGFSHVDIELCNMLEKFQSGIKEETLMVFAMYFSLVSDGNVCMCLDQNALNTKWKAKWQGLIAAADSEDSQVGEYANKDFSEIIKKGTEQILNGLSNIVANDVTDTGKLFVIEQFDDKNWLFTTKYNHAVNSVSEKLCRLFKVVKVIDLEENKTEVVNFFKQKSGIELNPKQAEAVVRGQQENLIISGGPGYGKTTVVCYLLWWLLKSNPDVLQYNVYLAAPSGKAQDRLKESINDELKKLKEVDNSIFTKLTNAQSFTIHRLLSYNPLDNKFRYNKEHQFPQESIFVIDEASMIDICLFQQLLEAIPEGARLFILGDPYQLPSVQAGAVLGDILDASNNTIKNIVELDLSNRFSADSELGNLAKNIKEQKTIDCLFNSWNVSEDCFNLNNSKKKYPVKFISLDHGDNITKKDQVNDIVIKWAETFCNYSKECKIGKEITEEDLNSLWNKVNSARILCAERRGKVGVETLNKLVSSKVRNGQGGENYPGQQLILTQNQRMFDLYNGDCGVVVTFSDNKTPYLMLEKPTANNLENKSGGEDCIKRIGRYLFYPIHIIPVEAIEMAFAITIHKSQGSGYDNIMVFIPEKLEHPLLNNQIIYTAVTRSKGCTYIVGSSETMKKAIESKIVRDTKIRVER